jgi:hypothetical protein
VRLNWYRGFYRLWLVLTVLWVVGVSATVLTMDSEQKVFERRVAAARALYPEAAKHGGLLLTPKGDPCSFPKDPEFWETCGLNPRGPHDPNDLNALWITLFAVPAAFYGLLRTLAWILGGFGRTA